MALTASVIAVTAVFLAVCSVVTAVPCASLVAFLSMLPLLLPHAICITLDAAHTAACTVNLTAIFTAPDAISCPAFTAALLCSGDCPYCI
jgi:hypothetical protein